MSVGRRRVVRTLIALASSAALAGCHALPPFGRKPRGEVPPPVSQGSEPQAGESPDQVLDVNSPTPRPFFKNSRLSGALSDEGREVERSLGIR